MYAKGMTTRDISEMLSETYGIEASATTISAITEKVMTLVTEWQSRPLESIYPIVFLDAIHVRMKKEGKVQNTAVYAALAVNLEGHKDVLGHWIGEGGEGANFWLKVITDLKNRGVEDVLIACVDGLTEFSEAIHSVYPQAEVQRCIIHQIRNTLKYVSWKDKDAFMTDLRTVYQATTKEDADLQLETLRDNWGKRYAIAVKSWENNWSELSTFFQYIPEIRRIMYTTNSIESYNRQLRKVIKTKSIFPTTESVQKMLYLAYRDINRQWDKSIPHWPTILNQLIIKFEGRITV
jgi:transposase-like protein